jgi:hypothetical protein
MYGWRTRIVFLLLSRNNFWTNSASYEYKNRSTFSAHKNADGLLEDQVSKDYISIVYKKAKHILISAS